MNVLSWDKRLPGLWDGKMDRVASCVMIRMVPSLVRVSHCIPDFAYSSHSSSVYSSYPAARPPRSNLRSADCTPFHAPRGEHNTYFCLGNHSSLSVSPTGVCDRRQNHIRRPLRSQCAGSVQASKVSSRILQVSFLSALPVGTHAATPSSAIALTRSVATPAVMASGLLTSLMPPESLGKSRGEYRGFSNVAVYRPRPVCPTIRSHP